jgi:hypothetical protein
MSPSLEWMQCNRQVAPDSVYYNVNPMIVAAVRILAPNLPWEPHDAVS